MPMPFGDDTIDLSGLPTGGAGGGAPTSGGGGGATNMFNSSAVPYYDQWMYAQLFTGWRSKRVKGREFGGGGHDLGESTGYHRTRTPQYTTPFAMLQAFDAFSTAEYQKFKNKLVAAGFISDSASPVDVRSAYASILKDVQGSQGQGVDVSPFQYINSLIRKNGFDPKDIPAKAGWDPTAAAAGVEGDGFQPSTTKVTSVYDLAPEDAESLLTQMLQSKLGRDPTKAELEDFVDAVKSRATADPTTEITQQRRGDHSGEADANTQVAVQSIGGKSYSTISTVNDGFDQGNAEAMAGRRAENSPDYASYQAVSTYFPAFIQALGATV